MNHFNTMDKTDIEIIIKKKKVEKNDVWSNIIKYIALIVIREC